MELSGIWFLFWGFLVFWCIIFLCGWELFCVRGFYFCRGLGWWCCLWLYFDMEMGLCLEGGVSLFCMGCVSVWSCSFCCFVVCWFGILFGFCWLFGELLVWCCCFLCRFWVCWVCFWRFFVLLLCWVLVVGFVGSWLGLDFVWLVWCWIFCLRWRWVWCCFVGWGLVCCCVVFWWLFWCGWWGWLLFFWCVFVLGWIWLVFCCWVGWCCWCLWCFSWFLMFLWCLGGFLGVLLVVCSWRCGGDCWRLGIFCGRRRCGWSGCGWFCCWWWLWWRLCFCFCLGWLWLCWCGCLGRGFLCWCWLCLYFLFEVLVFGVYEYYFIRILRFFCKVYCCWFFIWFLGFGFLCSLKEIF